MLTTTLQFAFSLS